MNPETRTLIKAALIPRGFQSLLPFEEMDSVALRMARKQKLSRSTLFILAVGENSPTPRDALGMLYFTQVVKSSDDAIDRNNVKFSDAQSLRNFLLNSEVPGVHNVKVKDLLERCLHCYPPDKQRAISSFIDQMVNVHLENPHRGIPGTYSYQEVVDYRRVTNDPLVETFAELTGSSKARFVSIGRAWQLIEDAMDWTEDAQEQSKNLFLGMATDTWHQRGT